MSFKRYFIWAVGFGVQGFIANILHALIRNSGGINSLLGLPPGAIDLSFLTVICWSLYFLVGSTPKGALAAWVSLIPGLISGVIIFVLSGQLAAVGLNFDYLALPLAAIPCIVVICLFGRLKYANMTPISFIALGFFGASFGLSGAAPNAGTYLTMSIVILFYAAYGFIMGGITMWLLTALDDSPKPAEK
jgi:hypothetical protein